MRKGNPGIFLDALVNLLGAFCILMLVFALINTTMVRKAPLLLLGQKESFQEKLVLPSSLIGQKYKYVFPVCGGVSPLSCSLESGDLPAGLQLKVTGKQNFCVEVSGIAEGRAQEHDFEVRV